MNATLASGLTYAVMTCAFASSPAALADATCDPKVVSSKTLFPLSSQLRHQTGTVLIEVRLDKTGKPHDVTVVQSSGYRLLDRAAARSVLRNWTFDISHCSHHAAALSDLIAVEYRGSATNSRVASAGVVSKSAARSGPP